MPTPRPKLDVRSDRPSHPVQAKLAPVGVPMSAVDDKNAETAGKPTSPCTGTTAQHAVESHVF